MGVLRKVEARVFKQLRLPAPGGLLGRLAIWLLVFAALTTLCRLLGGKAGQIFFALSLLSTAALFVVLVPLIWRYTIGLFLWKLRNRLIVTYLLMGLAPVVLFVTLIAIATYIFLGQFAIFAADAQFGSLLQQISSQNLDDARHLAHSLKDHPLPLGTPVPLPEASFERAVRQLPTSFAAFVDGKPVALALEPTELDRTITSVPTWEPSHFRGVVLAGNSLLLRSSDTEQVGSHTVTVISSMPLAGAALDQVAQGLGRITIVPRAFSGASDAGAPITSETSMERAEAMLPGTLVGGRLRPAQHLLDVKVSFFVPLDTVDWHDGKTYESSVHITSRPSLLYARLFITSLKVATFVQDLLIALTIFFGLLELGAFLMAMRLNQTITRSINDLYGATLAVDSGNFTHRIEVTRKDQLAALSQSFNTMTASVERLLEEQREKERLQGELEIAQEVQASLFPSGHVSLPTLEVHGICQPARTVSGDYYDFLVAGSSELSLALGDISGKGISAALLMATLHSAVRAYRFAGEDMRASEVELAGGGFSESGHGSVVTSTLPLLGASFADPAQILGLLNRHLFRSTQAAKYATLFLAHYNGLTSELTYSTGGQPPPLLLRADDTIVRLDCGGTVIGLIDSMRYEQGRETMGSGDILIAYSDGVTEPENDFGEFGEERLVDLVRRHRKLPLEQVADQILLALRSWIGAAEQPDDITLVLARQK